MNTKKITERLYYISPEDAETMTREAAVGREKYINETIVEQHGSITEHYVDFPQWVDAKGNIIGDDDPVIGTIERKKEGNKIVNVAVPEKNREEIDGESIAEVKEIKKADQKLEEAKLEESQPQKKKRKTKGDKISEYESNEGLLNNINKDYL
jgi:hypothetical protein